MAVRIANVLKIIGMIAALVIATAILPAVADRLPAANIKTDKVYDEQDVKLISKLYRSLAFDQILNEFSDYDWAQQRDPIVLMLYCSALVESGSSIPSNLQSPTVPAYISDFTKGYVSMLKGETHVAKALFKKLIGVKESRIWGYIGLLDQSLFTNNISSMEPILKELINNRNIGTEIPEWILIHYNLAYNYYAGNYDKVVNLLQAVNDKQYIADEFVYELRVRLLLRQNHFVEAQNILNRGFASIGETQDLIVVQSELYEMQYGVKHAIQYLQKMEKRFPRMWKVRQMRAFYRMDIAYSIGIDDNQSIDEIVEVLKDIANSREFDVPTQLALIDTLINMGRHNEAGPLLNRLNKRHLQLTDFALYNFLMAELDLLAGRKYSLKRNLEEALCMAPMDPHILWFVYKIAKDGRQYEQALYALKQLLRIDPYNQAALASLTKLYIQIGDWEKAFDTGNILINSKRYVDPVLRNKVETYVGRALSELGRH